jgi:colanic acid biosynthesis protein WcaH
MRKKSKTKNRLRREPKPGEWLEPEEFAEVIRLTPLISIDLIARSPEGKVLVGRRRHEPAKDKFFVPGGRIGKNETLAMAFARVARDELGVKLRIDQAHFRGVYEHFYRTNRLERKGFGTHYVVLAYEVTVAVNAAGLPADQHGEYAWMTPAELVASPEVHENTKAYFTCTCRHSRRGPGR